MGNRKICTQLRTALLPRPRGTTPADIVKTDDEFRIPLRVDPLNHHFCRWCGR